MRVQEMFYLVNHALRTWTDPAFKELVNRNGGITAYSCINAPQLVNLLEPLRPFPEISEQISIIYSTDKAFCKGAPGVLTPDEMKKIRAAVGEIKSELLTMKSMCAALGVESSSIGFDIKLPPNISLSELSKCARDLDNIFSRCPLLQEDGEEVRLRGVDVGSTWLTFAVICAGTAAASYIVHNLAAMVDEIIAIREHEVILKQQEELWRQAKVKNDLLDKMVEANKNVIDSLMEQASEKLLEAQESSNPEDVEAMRGSMSMLKEWINKGMEVYAAIDAPKEVKSAFPPVERQALSGDVMKALTGAVSKDDES